MSIAATRPGVEMTVVRGFIALRTFDLAQAVVAVSTGSLANSTNRWLDVALLVTVFIESVLVGGWLLRRRSIQPLRWPIAADFVLAAAAIGLSVLYTSPADRVGVWSMWGYPLGLSTAALLGVSGLRWRWLLTGSGILAVGYVAVVAVPLAGDRTGQSTALANAMAFPGFAIVAHLFMHFVRGLADTADAATARVAHLERDRSRALVHNLLPYLRLDRFADADEQTRLEMVAQAQATYDHMRSYVDGKQSVSDLNSCVRSVLGMHGRLSTRVHMENGQLIALPDEAVDHLHRAIDTALANVEQHAPRATVTLSATATDERIEIVVHDDGPGFDSTSVRPGFGIAEILGRQLAHVGGTGAVRSMPGGGTEVRITIPKGQL